jgi:hypothetical protein
MAAIGGVKLLSPTPGATVSIVIDNTVPKHIASWTAGQAETINISGTPQDGQELILIVTNDGTLGRILTLGTGIVGAGIITGIVSKQTVIDLIASGGSFFERSRSVGM